MGKTVEQKLLSQKNIIRDSKKTIKSLEQKVYAIQHQLDTRDGMLKKAQAEAQISNAKAKSAEMYIAYLAERACACGEVRIPFEELTRNMTECVVDCKWDGEKREVLIQVQRKATEPKPAENE